jgi:hypothetical protein
MTFLKPLAAAIRTCRVRNENIQQQLGEDGTMHGSESGHMKWKMCRSSTQSSNGIVYILTTKKRPGKRW